MKTQLIETAWHPQLNLVIEEEYERLWGEGDERWQRTGDKISALLTYAGRARRVSSHAIRAQSRFYG